MNDAIKAQISAFVDGELPDNEGQLLLLRMSQDGSLRQQAAEYMAMGRILRGERVIVGLGQLRERISGAIDDQSVAFSVTPPAIGRSRFLRPVAGVGIAAAVALVAILGLQQLNIGTVVDETPVSEIVTDTSIRPFTVPSRDDDQLQEYLRRHAESASFIGAGSINTRLVTLELNDGELVEIEPRPAVGIDEAPGAAENMQRSVP